MTTRRGVIAGMAAGLLAASGLALGAVYRFTDIFVTHYPPTPYDDVLVHLIDRRPAITLGKAILRDTPRFDMRLAVAKLRTAFGAGGLSVAATIDAVNGRTMEAHGWVVPESVGLVAALAANI